MDFKSSGENVLSTRNINNLQDREIPDTEILRKFLEEVGKQKKPKNTKHTKTMSHIVAILRTNADYTKLNTTNK